MTLTLTRLLEIETKLVPLDEDRGLMLARDLWNNAGRPSEPRALCRALEHILTVCQQNGVRYPAILLRRKKELERGSWTPQPGAAALEDFPGDPNCTRCHGIGTIANPGGLSGRPCECFIRKHSAKPQPAPPESAAL